MYRVTVEEDTILSAIGENNVKLGTCTNDVKRKSGTGII